MVGSQSLPPDGLEQLSETKLYWSLCYSTMETIKLKENLSDIGEGRRQVWGTIEMEGATI